MNQRTPSISNMNKIFVTLSDENKFKPFNKEKARTYRRNLALKIK